ncbi:MAG: hypothetical protein R3C14_08465 [Caldilineaceae bacterium]
MQVVRRVSVSFFLALLCVLGLATVALAENVVTDGDGLSGFELYTNGLIWWNGNAACGESFQAGAVHVQPLLTANFVLPLVNDCHALQGGRANAVRDEAYIYFFVQGQLVRKPLIADETTPAETIASAPALPAGQASAALLLAEGNLYWGRYNSTTQQSSLQQMANSGNSAPTTLTTVNGAIVRMRKTSYIDSNNQAVQTLVILLDNGGLWRYRLNHAGAPQLLAANVTDFAIHRVTNLAASTTYVYAANGLEQPDPSTPAGRLLRINIDNFQTAMVYQAQGHNQILAVATDSDQNLLFESSKKIYLLEAAVQCDLLCSITLQRILRHTLPATNDANWQLLSAPGVRGNLRSDNTWLYYMAEPTNGPTTRIDRISTDAPAVELDLKVDGVEVVQTIQNLKIDVKLVTDKPTYVRGYAHLAKNTTGVARWYPDARLRGFRNGQELAGSPLAPLNQPALTTESDINVLRNALARSYLFQLPEAWVAAGGNLTFQMTLDPQLKLPETGSRADDTGGMMQAAHLLKKQDVCLDFVRIHTDSTISNLPRGFTSIVERTRSMLPIPQFDIHRINTIISRPSLEVNVECWGPFCAPIPSIEGKPFHFPQDRDLAMAIMIGWDIINGSAGQCQNVHTVGMVAPNEQEFNGVAFPVIWASLVRMEADDGSESWNSPFAGPTLAHEIGHNLFRFHVDQTMSATDCGGSKPNWPFDDYPYDTCTLGGNNTFMGFDAIHPSVILPESAADTMSYADRVWTSDFTWNGILGWIPDGPTGVQAAGQHDNAADSPQLLVSGVISVTEQQGQFNMVYLLPAGVAPQAKLNATAAGHHRTDTATYQIRQLDSSGATLAIDSLSVISSSGHISNLVPFAQYIPLNGQTKRVQLAAGDHVLAERTATPHTPTLTLHKPVVDETAHTLALEWLSADEDNTLAGGFHDMVTFVIQYSTDNGATWQNLLINYPWLATTVDTRQLPGSSQARVRIIVTDGFNTNLAVSEPFVLKRHAPEVLFAGLAEGARVPFTETIHLMGLALDPEEGTLAGADLHWSLSGPTSQSSSGEAWMLSQLAPGNYTVTVKATDNDVMVGIGHLHFVVLPLVVNEGSAITLDGHCGDSAYAGATVVRIPQANNGYARVWLAHQNGKLYACFADLTLSPAGQPKMMAGLRIDTNSSGETQVQSGDMGFLVDQNGLAYQYTAANGHLTPSATPQLGFAVWVFQNAQGWNAEMSIDETLVGGWDHAVRLMLSHTAEGALFSAGAGAQGLWPPAAGVDQPNTWAAAYLGVLPAQPNRAPVANAGDDLFVNVALTQTVQLYGDLSADPDGDALSYLWTQVAGPTVALLDATTALPSFVTGPVNTSTTLRFQLVVNDGALNSPADEVVIKLLPTLRPHTPATYTPPDYQAGATQQLFLPFVTK